MMLTKVKSLTDTVSDVVAHRVFKGHMSLHDVGNLDIMSESVVMDKLLKYDLQVWRYNIMKSLSFIELNKCKDYTIDFEKVYINGTRDYREIIYIYHDGDEQHDTMEDLYQEDIDENYVPVYPVKIVDVFHDHYDIYLDTISETYNFGYNDHNDDKW